MKWEKHYKTAYREYCIVLYCIVLWYIFHIKVGKSWEFGRVEWELIYLDVILRFLLGDEDHLFKPYNGATYIYLYWHHPSVFTSHTSGNTHFHLSSQGTGGNITSICIHFTQRKNDVNLSSLQTTRKRWRLLVFGKRENTDVHLSFLNTSRKHWPPSFFTSDSEEHWSPSVSTVVQTARNTEVHLSLL